MPDTAKDRIAHWKSRLIDLSLRNKLLNCRVDRSGAVPIVGEVPRVVYARLVDDEETFGFRPRAEQGAAPAEGGEYRPLADADLRPEHTDAVLQTTLAPKDLDKALYHLYLKSKTSFEDQGVVTLFLAVGFLRWFEPTSPPEGRLAPVLLLPAVLTRAGVGRPFVLHAAPEDPQVNPSLLRKLEVEYGARPAIAQSEEGLDPDAVLSALRAVLPDPRWQVLSDMHLGLFSFSKYIMYRDLEDQADALLTHRLVGRLAGADVKEAASAAPAAAAERPPAEVHQILDADSSQQSAIEAVRRGSDLVLQGPPGTGKSQTIANLVAETLADGKTVLFVSEKMAALEVVKRRLDACGLSDYVLELHSRHAVKRDVVMELKRCLERDRAEAPPPGPDLARLPEAKAALDRYAEALHSPFGTGGLTPFDAHGALAGLAATPDIPLAVERPEDLPAERRADLARLLGEAALARDAVEPADRHPWRMCRLTSIPRTVEIDLRARLDSLGRLVADLAAKTAARAGELAFPPPADLAGAENLASLLAHLARSPRPEPAWVTDPAWAGASAEGRAIAARVKRFREGRDALARHWTDALYALALDDLLARRRKAGTGIFRLLRPSYHRDRKTLAPCLRPGAARSPAEIIDDLARAVDVRDTGAAIDRDAARAQAVFGRFFTGRESDFAEMTALADWVERLRGFCGGPAGPAVAAAAGEPKRFDAPAAEVRDALRAVKDEQAAIAALLDAEGLPGGLAELATWVDEAKRRAEDVHAFAAWRRAQAALAETGLAPFVTAAQKAGVPPSGWIDAHAKAFAGAYLDRAREARPLLRDFDRAAHEAAIRRYRELDTAQFRAAVARLRARLDAGLPSNRSFSPQSDVGLLLREAAKKRRHLPVRALLDRAGAAVRRLKPCFMMSPLSVAQFLPVSSEPFDLVVFDEASQICPEDAIGAIARGQRLVVVGDSRQLPPTSFFAYDPDAARDDEPEDAPPDLESVLDLCAASGLPSERLRWHYRSRDESLIAFSNRHFYDGALFTFPGPGGDRDLGVTFHRVEGGTYARGGSRDNRVEAKAVAEGIAAHLAAHPRDSVGAVAFSEAQQRAVLAEVEAIFRARPELEAAAAARADEPLFVKNLENVQGDERDVMFFSIGYGRDEDGRLTMNFGPLNGDGGHRRLNVAVTRARKAVHVFASLDPEDIDPARTSSAGARLLREYLLYARDRTAAAAAASGGETTPLVAALEAALGAEGLRVGHRLGSSSWRLDLAVAKPGATDRWLVGIETDGPAYRAAATTRDRERTRPEVLSRLGWRLLRVWAPDYVRSPAKEKARILAEVEAAAAAAPAPAAAVPPAPAPAASAPPSAPENGTAAGPRRKPRKTNGGGPDGPPPYVPTPKRLLRVRGTFDEDEAEMSRLILAVAAQEGPVHVEVVLKRVVAAYDTRTTERMRAAFERALARVLVGGLVERRGDFLWPEGVVDCPLRGPSEDDEVRDIAHVPAEEIADGARTVLAVDLRLPREALVRAVAGLLGHRRPGEAVLARTDAVIGAEVAAGRFVDVGGAISLSA